MKIRVLTISDRASRGEYEDLSGPEVERVLQEGLDDPDVSRRIVSDEPWDIEQAFLEGLDCDVILTTGGTGLSPRDHTPDVTERICDRLIPGITEALRAYSLTQTPQAMLSRSLAGIKGTTLIINLPGSVKGARFCTEWLLPVLPHAKRMIAGEGH